MSDSDALREKLASFDAETEPEAFWDLLTEAATERVAAAFALVLLQDEDEEFVVYPGHGIEPEDLDDLSDSPTFAAAVEAVGTDGAAVGGDGPESVSPDGSRSEAPDGAEPIFSAAVPLRIGGEVAGALAVERYEAGPFTEADTAALQALIDVFGPSLAKFFE